MSSNRLSLPVIEADDDAVLAALRASRRKRVLSSLAAELYPDQKIGMPHVRGVRAAIRRLQDRGLVREIGRYHFAAREKVIELGPAVEVESSGHLQLAFEADMRKTLGFQIAEFDAAWAEVWLAILGPWVRPSWRERLEAWVERARGEVDAMLRLPG